MTCNIHHRRSVLKKTAEKKVVNLRESKGRKTWLLNVPATC